ncbi:MAG: DUF4160 domain-containing protein [Eubacteriales bacterium]
MPVITRLGSMVIKMYFLQSEHNPPHFHVIDGEFVGVYEIKTKIMMEGDLPSKSQKEVIAWLGKYQTDMLEMWETQNFKQLPPI